MSNLIANKLNSLPEQVEDNRKNILTIGENYYDKTNDIVHFNVDPLSFVRGARFGSKSNAATSSLYIVKKLATIPGYVKIFGASMQEAVGKLGCVRIHGTIGSLNSSALIATIDLTIPIGPYIGECWGTYYATQQATTPVDKVELFIGIIDDKVNVYSLFKESKTYVLLNVETTSLCDDLTLNIESTMPNWQHYKTLSDLVSAGNVKNLLA